MKWNIAFQGIMSDKMRWIQGQSQYLGITDVDILDWEEKNALSYHIGKF